MTWKKRADLAPNTVEFTLFVSYRRSAVGSNTNVGDTFTEQGINFGDGTSYSGVFLVLAIDPTADWVFGRAVPDAQHLSDPILHTYSSPGPFTAQMSSCCRISSLLNSSGANYRVFTVVDLNVETNSPVSNLPPIVNVLPGGVRTFNVVAADADNDRLTYRLATTGSESGLTSHPPNISVDQNTGTVTWDTNGLTAGLYATQVIIESRDMTNSLKTSVGIDFILNLTTNTSGSPPVFDRPPTPVNDATRVVTPGTPVSFTVQASDSDAGSTVTLNAVGLPPGTTLTNALPRTGNPVTTTFNWTPTTSDLGPHVVVFTATDNTAQQTLFAITINVAANIFARTYQTGLFIGSFPCNITDPTAVFGPNPLIASWDSQSQAYVVSGAQQLSRGVSYWIKFTGATNVTLANCDDQTPLSWQLRRGWNLVGNGFSFDLDVSFADAQVLVGGTSQGTWQQVAQATDDRRQILGSFLWVYDGAAYRIVTDPSLVSGVPASFNPSSLLKRGEGAWLFCNQDNVTVQVSPPAHGGSRVLRQSAVATGHRWIKSLEVQAGASVDRSLSFGFDTTQRAAAVRYQKPPSAPTADRSVDVFMADGGVRYAADVRRSLNAGDAWDFVVTTNGPGEDVQLRWPSIGTLSRAYRLTLVDLTTGARRSMRAAPGYSFRSDRSAAPRRFRIEVGATDDNRMTVSNVSLSRVGPGYRVAYSLTREAEVTARLLNAAGKVVATVTPTRARAGLNSLQIEAKDALGRQSPHGVYLLELVAQTDEGDQVKAVKSLNVN